MQHKRFALSRFHQAGQLVLLLRWVDVGVARVVENPKQSVEANVDAGRLHQGVVEGIDSQPPSGDFGSEVAIGEQHAKSVAAPMPRPMSMTDAMPDASLPNQHRRCSSMAEHQLPKLNTRVRFPSSAPLLAADGSSKRSITRVFGAPRRRAARL